MISWIENSLLLCFLATSAYDLFSLLNKEVLLFHLKELLYDFFDISKLLSSQPVHFGAANK